MPIIQINGHLYDFTNYVINHPGEKPSSDVSIRNYSNKETTERFNQAHNKKGRWEVANTILDNARKNGQCDGLVYIGPAQE